MLAFVNFLINKKTALDNESGNLIQFKLWNKTYASSAKYLIVLTVRLYYIFMK